MVGGMCWGGRGEEDRVMVVGLGWFIGRKGVSRKEGVVAVMVRRVGYG